MAKAHEDYMPVQLDIYVMKTQAGYNRFQRYLVVTDWDAALVHEYKQHAPEFIKKFHSNLVYTLEEQKEGEVELHCKGMLRTLTKDYSLDGYFGRPKIIFRKERFIRKLNAPERDYLQKQFGKLCRGKPLKLKLVD